MARRSSGRSARRPAFRRAPAPAPAPVNHAPPPAPAQNRSGGSVLGSIGSTIAEGMAFGGGSAIAHRAVDSLMGPRVIQHETVAAQAPSAAAAPATNSVGNADACGMQFKAFQDCVNSSGDDISRCQFYMDMLSECKRNSMLNA